MKYKAFNLLPSFQTNTFLVWCEKTNKAVIIDPASETKTLADFIKKNNLEVEYILNTHGHLDHIGGNEFYKNEFKCKLAIHEDDAECLTDANKNLSALTDGYLVSPEADILLKEGDVISFGKESFKVIHTPGHTQGGVCFYTKGYLFAGDTLFKNSIGRTDLPGGNHSQLINAIKKKLFTLNENTVVLCGHGPNTSIKEEKMLNPYASF